MTPEVVAQLARTDSVLEHLIEKVGPITLKVQRRQSPFEALVESVVYQQLTGKAAATIFARVKALFPDKKFPTPQDLIRTPIAAFRSAGLSGAKTAALQDIAAKTLDGVVPDSRTIRKMSDSEIIERLTSIRGVGPWTVEMLLIFKLGRPDVFPSSDYGVRKGFAIAYRKKELPTPKALLAFSERWKPYRTTAAWYLWRATDMGKVSKGRANS